MYEYNSDTEGGADCEYQYQNFTHTPTDTQNSDNDSGNDLIEKQFIYGREFSSVEEAEELYNNYARSKGFGVRKDIKRQYPDGKVKSRRWVCSKEGFRPHKFLVNKNRKRAPRPMT